MVRVPLAPYIPAVKVVAFAFVAIGGIGGCSFSGQLGGSSIGGSPRSPGFQSARMPNLFGRTPAEAATLLRQAGFVVVSAEERDGDCGEGGDHVMAPKGAICAQSPVADIDTDPREVRLKYTLERDAFDHGGVGDAAWRRMPGLVGMSLPDAQAALARAQLPADRYFDVVVADNERCRPGIVCEQSPAPKDRMRLAGRGRLVVGAASPEGPPPSAQPTPPAQPAPAPQPTTPDTYF